MKNRVFKSKRLPFFELRYVEEINYCDKKHFHDELTITAIKEGSIDIIYNDETILLTPNHISIINPHEIHCINSKGISKGCYVLYLNSQWCENIEALLLNKVSEYIPIGLKSIKEKSTYDEFMNLCDKLLDKRIDLLEKEEELIDFMSNIFTEYLDRKVMPKISNKNSELALKIEKFILKNIHENILIEEIASYMNLSVIHVLRVFKKEFGLPIHAYILNKKVHKAKELLNANLPIIEVALQSGFFDQSHLNRSFKRVFQITPKEYQKNILS